MRARASSGACSGGRERQCAAPLEYERGAAIAVHHGLHHARHAQHARRQVHVHKEHKRRERDIHARQRAQLQCGQQAAQAEKL